MSRPDWHTYFMQQSHLVASRSTCDRKHIGAVIVRDRRILATGYNGSLPKQAHCDEVGHDMQEGHCVRNVHAEVNAVAQAAYLGVSTKGATIYCTAYPCWNCFKTIVSAGINKVFYGERYRADECNRVQKYANQFFVDFYLRQWEERT